MGACASAVKIPGETQRAANIVAKQSGFKKAIVTTYYKNPDVSIVYKNGISTYLVCKDIMKSDDIICIHVVKGIDDLLVETLPIVYVISASLNLYSKPPPEKGIVLDTLNRVTVDEDNEDDIRKPFL